MRYSKNLNHYYTAVLLILMFALVSTGVSAQTINADSTKFAIGSKVNLTVQVPFNAGDKIIWPALRDTITKSIEVLSKSKVDTITLNGGNSKALQQVISITSFDTGYIVVPPLQFTITKNGAQPIGSSTKPLMLQVYKVKVDPAADIKEIKPILDAPLTFRELIPWILGAIVLALLIYALLKYLKYRKRPKLEKPQVKIKVPVWEIALQKLEALKLEQLWQKGDIKEYYTRITDILREYFEMRYNVNAAEMTSSEIIEAVSPHIIEKEALPPLKNLLFLSDMAKFAKGQPGTYENEQSFVYAVEIVNYTKPAVRENGSEEKKVI